MSGIGMKILISGFIFSFSAISAYSAGPVSEKKDSLQAEGHGSIFPEKSYDLSKSHFTWGAEAGASIDCTGHDLSTFDVDVNLGYKNRLIDILGVSAGIHRSVQNGANFIPVCLVFRSSFRKKPSLFFLNLKMGYSFNTIGDSPTFGDFCSSLGCGINLSRTRRVKTFLIASLGYRYFNKRHQAFVEKLDTHYVYIAQLTFGVNF